tara:strand:+ start:544 stop:786 length:243 start_codon:yes stop_codon:yes gene_type:complete
MAENKKSAGTKWDGISRPSDDLYRKNYNEIFGKKEQDELNESYKQSIKNKKERTDDRGPADLERVIDTLKKKIRKLENSR